MEDSLFWDLCRMCVVLDSSALLWDRWRDCKAIVSWSIKGWRYWFFSLSPPPLHWTSSSWELELALISCGLHIRLHICFSINWLISVSDTEELDNQLCLFNMVSRWPQSAFASINFSAVINVVSHRWEREKIESELCLIEWQTNKRWRRENMFLFLAGRQPTISATGRVCPLQLYSPRTPCNFVFFLVLGWFGTATQRLWSCVPVKAALGANTAEQQGGHLFFF